MRDVIPLIEALANANVIAFQHALRFGEGTSGVDGYQTIFGGGHFVGLDGQPGTFDDFADHPRTVITRTMGGKVYRSSAAGAYQYMPPTWDEMATLYGLKDFSPKNQDIGCVGLFIKRKALDDIIAGRFEQAVKKCSWEWASLPGSPYGQPVVTMDRVKQEYEKWGGTYAPATDVVPVPVPTAMRAVTPISLPVPPTDQENNVPPFLLALLPSLIGAVPELAKMFGNGSEVADRNIKAAEVVAGIAKEALGAKNEQEVIEQMHADPAAFATVRDAIKDNWYQLVEVGGGIQAARESNIKVQGERTFIYNPAVWVSLLLLGFPLMLCVDVFYAHPDQYDGSLRTQIVTAILAVIMMVGAYWLGTTASSGKKDDTIKAMASS